MASRARDNRADWSSSGGEDLYFKIIEGTSSERNRYPLARIFYRDYMGRCKVNNTELLFIPLWMI